MNPAPIVLFVYNRPSHTRTVIDALKKNPLSQASDLIIYSDGPKHPDAAGRVQEVRRYLKTLTGFRSVTICERERNLGLANNTIDGLTEVANRHGRFIMLEDDNLTSPHFLQFMNEALCLYEQDPQFISVHGYVYPLRGDMPETFFIRGADTWGWAAWKRGWDLFERDGAELLRRLVETRQEREFNFGGAYNYVRMLKDQIRGRNDSWAIRWYASAFLGEKLTLYPGRSLVRNIGSGPGGTHSRRKTDVYDVPLSETPIRLARIPIEENKAMRRRIGRFLLTLNARLLWSYMKHACLRTQEPLVEARQEQDEGTLAS